MLFSSEGAGSNDTDIPDWKGLSLRDIPTNSGVQYPTYIPYHRYRRLPTTRPRAGTSGNGLYLPATGEHRVLGWGTKTRKLKWNEVVKEMSNEPKKRKRSSA